LRRTVVSTETVGFTIRIVPRSEPPDKQVAVTVVTTPDRAKAVGSHDAELVKAVEPGKK
jgi:hypothetical protein